MIRVVYCGRCGNKMDFSVEEKVGMVWKCKECGYEWRPYVLVGTSDLGDSGKFSPCNPDEFWKGWV